MNRIEVTEKIISTKVSKGIKWEAVAKKVGLSKEWVTALCLGQMTATAEQAKVVGKIFGLTPFETLMRVILPSATPMIAAGMRTGLSIAFIMIVVSEMIGSTDGLGYYILQAQRTFAIPEMYGGILLLAILGYLLNTGFVWAEHKVLAWHYGQTARPV